MKRLLVLCALLAPLAAQAQLVHFEAGVGQSWSKDMGDGTWYQEGVPHSEKLSSRSYLLGLTGDVYERGAWSVRAHADYVYFGTQRASCMCVPDSEYNPKTHTANVPGYIPFNGSGHVQGIAATLDAGHTWRGLRLAAEAGPWLFWNTWHVTRADPEYPDEPDLSHRTVAQLGWVAGLRLDNGDLSFSYRYYAMPQRWNPYPGLVTGTHMLMTTYRF